MYFRLIARAHSAPVIAPIRIAPTGVTDEQAGVIATRPATTPEAAPRVVAWPSRTRSTSSQASMAALVATRVLTKVTPAVVPAVSAEPALNPNQPNHSSPAPSVTSGRLCGFIGSLGQPIRLPSTRTRARPAAPALMCTAVPPAKSMALSWLAIQPPTVLPSPASKANTQWATGKYTTVAHSPANSSHGPNRARSAIAPEISATVMMANIAWNATNTVLGMVPASESAPSRPLRPRNSNGAPSRPPPTSLPKAMEYP